MYSNKINEGIPTLESVRKKEREEQKQKKDKECKELLLKAINYYNKNYPNSEKDLIWTKPKVSIEIGKDTLKNELNILSEKQLNGIFDIFKYFHDERQMPSIKDHDKMKYILANVKSLVPGGSFIEHLITLRDRYKEQGNEIEELEIRLEEERKKFNKKIQKNDHICTVCGRVCRSPSGLANHMRAHEKKEKKEPLS